MNEKKEIAFKNFAAHFKYQEAKFFIFIKYECRRVEMKKVFAFFSIKF